jgi:surface protein
MSIKHLILFLIFISVANFSKAFDFYSSSNRGEVGPAGSVCEGMLIVGRWYLLNATFSGSDAYVTKDGTNYYFGGTNGGVFTGQITDFKNIFLNKVNFNADIVYWDTSRATNFHGLFSNARSFNQDIGSWDVSNVTNFYRLYKSFLRLG